MRAVTAARELPRSGIRAVLEMAHEPGVVSLASGDPDQLTPEHVVEAAARAARQGHTHYTHGRGLPELRELWAAKLRAENGIEGIDPGTGVVATAGALNALSATFLALAGPGTTVLLPDPGFTNYRSQVLLAGATPVPYPCRHVDGFRPNLDELAALAVDADILVVNSPGNPTGVVLDAETLGGIAAIATERDLLVVSDEAYEHLVYAGRRHLSIAALPHMADRTLTIGSMSKSWAMTGWRLGLVAGPSAALEPIVTVQEHLIGCPTSVSQWAAVAALSGPTTARDAMVARYDARRRTVVSELAAAPGIDLVEPDGAFYAYPRLDVGLSGIELARAVATQAGVLTVPGTAFGAESGEHLRLSYATAEADLEEGLRRLAAWCRSGAARAPEPSRRAES